MYNRFPSKGDVVYDPEHDRLHIVTGFTHRGGRSYVWIEYEMVSSSTGIVLLIKDQMLPDELRKRYIYIGELDTVEEKMLYRLNQTQKREIKLSNSLNDSLKALSDMQDKITQLKTQICSDLVR